MGTFTSDAPTLGVFLTAGGAIGSAISRDLSHAFVGFLAGDQINQSSVSPGMPMAARLSSSKSSLASFLSPLVSGSTSFHLGRPVSRISFSRLLTSDLVPTR